MVDILLATCNSARFLREQLDSIVAQSFSQWHLLIHDAASKDETLQIIGEYRAEYPEKITFLGSAPATALENFAFLLENSTGDMIMFCDHDDVWFPDKNSRSADLLRDMEKKYGPQNPLCVFTDAIVTDEKLAPLCNSNLKNQHLDPVNGLSTERLLVQNVPSGNTMLFNAALKDLLLPFPVKEAVIHDHYTALTAACLGKIACLNEPTLFYRQHSKNLLGSTNYSPVSLIRKLLSPQESVKERFFANCRQAKALLELHGDRMPAEMFGMLKDFSEMEKLNWFGRKKVLLRHGIRKTGSLRNIGMFLMI